MKLRKELWFGFSLMALILGATAWFTPWTELTNGHLGLIMLAMIVVAVMLGFPTAFTLMGMGVLFAWFAYYSRSPELATRQVLDLMVQRAFGVMSSDTLIAVPLFVFMGYLVERAALIDRLFKSLHLALQRVPGSLAVATIVTCAIFATATGIVGAVVTLMGLLALPQMLRAGYSIEVAAGSITAGGCLGILIPPSVLLIVYGATAGVSVVQLYAGAFFPGLMLAGLYVVYVIVLARLRPEWMPPLPAAEREIALPEYARALGSPERNALPSLIRALIVPSGVSRPMLLRQLALSALPALVLALTLAAVYRSTSPLPALAAAGESSVLAQPVADAEASFGGTSETGLMEPPDTGTGLEEPPDAGSSAAEPMDLVVLDEPQPAASEVVGVASERGRLPASFYWLLGVGTLALAGLYARWSWERLEIFKMLLGSFFPLAVLILFVLGSIVFGFATPTEAAAVGALGGVALAATYRFLAHWRHPASAGAHRAFGRTLRDLGGIVQESAFLTAKTSAMVCWLFVGSAIFSAAFALLGGQEIVERWVLSLDLSPTQFLILAQLIIFLLGWPLEWTEIIVIFMPIFLPLLGHFHVDPLFFGLLVALNLQTAFLSPPVAMAAFYLKGVAPPHVRLTQIFAGMMPFMAIQVLAMVILYVFPQIGLWLPSVIYQ